MINRSVLIEILELARWAPSGDNSQPWMFRITGEDTIHVIGTDHATTDVYDFDGRPTLLTLGFLMETMAVVASKFNARIEWTYVAQAPHVHRIEVTVIATDGMSVDSLLPFVETRSVARGRYRTDALTAQNKNALQQALGKDFEIRWFETFAEKWKIARINMRATHIRLSIPEAFPVHQRILDWHNEHSPHGVPSKAIGLDPMSLSGMKWVMQNWERAHFMNRFVGGTVMPRMQMDLVPGIGCAAQFMVFGRSCAIGTASPEQLLKAGQALQRFWLTAASLGLVMQPSLAPLCFAYYAENQRKFTVDPTKRADAQSLSQALSLSSKQVSQNGLVFMGRIGTPVAKIQRSRSVRKTLESLMLPSDDGA